MASEIFREFNLSYHLNTDKYMYVRQLFEVRKGMTEMEQSKQYTQFTQDWL